MDAGLVLRPGERAGGAEVSERLAQAARRLVKLIVRHTERPEGRALDLARESLSVGLGAELSWEQLATVVAETAALAWAESGGRDVELPGPLRPVEAVLMRPGSETVAAALEAVRQAAAWSRKEVGAASDPGEDLYEPFLAQFDPDARARSSVYLTPQPLVRMVVESVDELLRDRLGASAGLAGPEVSLLDPAAGTGAFLLEALRVAGRAGQSLPSKQPWASWRGFEIRPGAYVAAALRLDRWTRETQYKGRRVRPVDLSFGDALAEDSPLSRPETTARAATAPGDTLVVVANPPWSQTHSCSGWMERLLRQGYSRRDGTVDDGFFRYQGRALGNRNTKWLKAHYVQFLRLAQWCVDRVGRGVVGLVLPDGIADNLTFAGLRESLLGSFEEILLVDVGGGSRKVPAEAGPDENVFGVRQGVCALLMVQGGSGRGVFRAQVRGSRREKLSWLASHTVANIPWQRLTPGRSGHLFIASSRGPEDDSAYWQAPSIPEIFEVGSIAVITGRDAVVVGFGERELASRIGMIRHAGGRVLELFGLRPSAQLEEARRKLAADEEWERHLVPYLFRPGDRRFLFAADYLVNRPRTRVMAELRRPGNLALLLPRRRRVFPSAWVSDCTASHRVASSYEGTHAFPLYVGPERQVNISAKLLARLEERYGERPTVEQILGFVYGLLWDGSFHQHHSKSLAQDWPRIPFPEDVRSFKRRSILGWRLARIHLGWVQPRHRPWFHGELPVRLPAEPARAFSHVGERLELGLSGGYLAPVSRETVEQRIGGYPVVTRWIRRRAGRRLGAQEIEELCRLIAALEATRRIEKDLSQLEE